MKRFSKQSGSVLAMFLVVAMITGCPQSTANNWQKAAALSQDFSASLVTIQQIEIDAFHAGKISPEDHVAVQKVFLEVAQDGKLLDDAIRQGSSSTTITSAFYATLAVTNNALATTATHIKDPALRATLTIALTAAKGTLDTMKALQ